MIEEPPGQGAWFSINNQQSAFNNGTTPAAAGRLHKRPMRRFLRPLSRTWNASRTVWARARMTALQRPVEPIQLAHLSALLSYTYGCILAQLRMPVRASETNGLEEDCTVTGAILKEVVRSIKKAPPVDPGNWGETYPAGAELWDPNQSRTLRSNSSGAAVCAPVCTAPGTFHTMTSVGLRA